MKTITTQSELKETIQSAASGRVVTVLFTASWCPPCAIVMPKYKELERDYPNALVTMVNIDDNEDMADENEVAGLPTVQFYRNGNKIHEVIGHNVQKLVDAFRRFAS